MFKDLFQQSGISLERLRTFCIVAQSGGITLAAGGDPTTQSLYSRQIKELEEFFGVELVRRKGRGVLLTQAGERLNAIASEFLASLRDFKNECAGRPLEISVAAGDSLIQWLILPNLKKLKERLPNTVFRFLNLSTAEVIKRLAEGAVDFGLIREDAATATLKSLPLGVMKHSLFSPKNLCLPSSQQDAMRLLDGIPLATLEGRGAFRQALASAYEKAALRLNIELECSSFTLVARGLQAGKLAAILPSLARVEFANGRIAEIQVNLLRRFDRKIMLTWNERVARIRPIVAQAKTIFAQELKF